MRYLKMFTIIFALLLVLSACDTSSEPSPFSSAQVSDIIHLGGLEWRVLDVQNNRALVISEHILSRRVWHYEQQLLTWEPSEIRQYLNSQFINDTFSEEERAFIVETTLVNNINPWYGSAGGGADTADRIFLLSLDEAIKYFGDSGILSEYAGSPITHLPVTLDDEYSPNRIARDPETGIASWWWLRTPGRAVSPRLDSSAVAINGAGEIFVYGIYLIMEGGVRPAMWLRM